MGLRITILHHHHHHQYYHVLGTFHVPCIVLGALQRPYHSVFVISHFTDQEHEA